MNNLGAIVLLFLPLFWQAQEPDWLPYHLFDRADSVRHDPSFRFDGHGDDWQFTKDTMVFLRMKGSLSMTSPANGEIGAVVWGKYDSSFLQHSKDSTVLYRYLLKRYGKPLGRDSTAVETSVEWVVPHSTREQEMIMLVTERLYRGKQPYYQLLYYDLSMPAERQR